MTLSQMVVVLGLFVSGCTGISLQSLYVLNVPLFSWNVVTLPGAEKGLLNSLTQGSGGREKEKKNKDLLKTWIIESRLSSKVSQSLS
jgi:hypothetical protein